MSQKSRKHPLSAKAVPTAQPPKTGAPVFAVCVFLLVSVFLVFGRTATFGYVDYDDPANVAQNPAVARGLGFGSIAWAFTHSVVGNWVPLTTLSHVLDSQIFGSWPGGHHLVNVLLHAINAILLFLVLRESTGAFWRCAFVAALFALHPLRAETVAWVSERKDTLAGVFFMLTLWAYVRWTRRPRSGLWVTAAFLTLGLLSKSMLVTTPLVLLLLDKWPLQRTRGVRLARLVSEKLPLIVLSVLAMLAQLAASRQDMQALDPSPLGTRLANAVVSGAAYLGQFFWPLNLSPFYPYPHQGVDGIALSLSALVLFAVSAAVYRWRRQAPWLVVGWLWYLIMLAPVLGFVQAGDVSRADRYTYLPQIGLSLMLAWTVATWCAANPGRRIVIASLALLTLLVSSVMAFRQTGFWKDSETMWNRALACTTNNDTAHYNLGTTALQKGDFDTAIAHFEATLEANPHYASAHMNMGRALLQKGRADEALVHYRRALDLKPGYAEAHYNIAMVLAQKGELEGAIANYQHALQINPAYLDAHNNLGSVLLQAGRLPDAIAQFEFALRIDPRNARVHNNLAAALVQKGRTAAGISHYEKALETDPGHVKALNSLAWLLATSSDAGIRQGSKAVQLAEKANQLTGGATPFLLRTLAAAHAETGDFTKATQIATRALDLATGQSNESLSTLLRADLSLYNNHKPLR